MKKFKVFIIIISALIIASLIALACFNKFYLPPVLKRMAETNIPKFTTLSSKIGKVEYSFLKGFIFKDVSLYDRSPANQVFFSEEINFKFLLLPIVKKKQLIITHLNVVKPHIIVSLLKESGINLAAYARQPETGKKFPFQVLIMNTDVSEGRVTFFDRRIEPIYRQEIGEIDFSSRFNIPDKMEFSLTAAIPQPQAKSIFTLSGNYNVFSRKLSSSLSISNFPYSEIDNYFRNLPLDITAGRSDKISADITFAAGNLSVKAEVPIDGLRFKYASCEVAAEWKIFPEILFSAKNNRLSIGGKAELRKTHVTGVPQINEIDDITGEISFNNQTVTLEDIKLQALGVPMDIQGDIILSAQPEVRIHASSKITAARISEAARSFNTPIQQIDGRIDFSLYIKGPLAQNTMPDLNGYFSLKQGLCKISFLPETIKDIDMRVGFSGNKIEWSQAEGIYAGRRIRSDGKITELPYPLIKVSVSGNDISFIADAKIGSKETVITNVSARYFNSFAQTSGTIENGKTSSILDIKSSGKISINELMDFLPKELADKISKAKPDGTVTFGSVIKGDISKLKDCQIAADLSCPRLSLNGVILEKAFSTITQNNNHLEVSRTSAVAYGGQAGLSASLDTTKDVPEYECSLNLTNINLGLLKNDIRAMKDHNYSGILNAESRITGKVNDLNSINGEGSLSLNGARVTEFGPISGIGKFILKNSGDLLVITGGSASFLIRNGVLSSEDLILSSENVILRGKGSLALNGKIDFDLETEVHESSGEKTAGETKAKSPIEQITSAIFATGPVINISGNVQNPKFKVKSVKNEPLKAIQEITKGLKDILFGK